MPRAPHRALMHLTDYARLAKLLAKTGVRPVDAAWEAVDRSGLHLTKRQRAWRGFWRRNRHRFTRGTPQWPAERILFQAAIEADEESPVRRGAEKFLVRGGVTWPWLRRLSPPTTLKADPIDTVIEHGILRPGSLALDERHWIVFDYAGASPALAFDIAAHGPREVEATRADPLDSALAIAGHVWAGRTRSGRVGLWLGAALRGVLDLQGEQPAALQAFAPGHLGVWTKRKHLRVYDTSTLRLVWGDPAQAPIRACGQRGGKLALAYGDNSFQIVDLARGALVESGQLNAPAIGDGNFEMWACRKGAGFVAVCSTWPKLLVFNSARRRVQALSFDDAGWYFETTEDFIIAYRGATVRVVDLARATYQQFDLKSDTVEHSVEIFKVQAISANTFLLIRFDNYVHVLRAAKKSRIIKLARMGLSADGAELSDGSCLVASLNTGRMSWVDLETGAARSYGMAHPNLNATIFRAPDNRAVVISQHRFAVLEPHRFADEPAPRARWPVNATYRLDDGGVIAVTSENTVTKCDAATGAVCPMTGDDEEPSDVFVVADGSIYARFNQKRVRRYDPVRRAFDEVFAFSPRVRAGSAARLIAGTHLTVLTGQREPTPLALLAVNLFTLAEGSINLPAPYQKGGFAGDAGVWLYAPGHLAFLHLTSRTGIVRLRHAPPDFRPQHGLMSGDALLLCDASETIVWDARTGKRRWAVAHAPLFTPLAAYLSGERLLFLDDSRLLLLDRRRGKLADFTSARIFGGALLSADRAVARMQEGVFIHDADGMRIVDPETFQSRHAAWAAAYVDLVPSEANLRSGTGGAFYFAGGVAQRLGGRELAMWHGDTVAVPLIQLADGRIVADAGQGSVVVLQPWFGNRPVDVG